MMSLKQPLAALGFRAAVGWLWKLTTRPRTTTQRGPGSRDAMSTSACSTSGCQDASMVGCSAASTSSGVKPSPTGGEAGFDTDCRDLVARKSSMDGCWVGMLVWIDFVTDVKFVDVGDASH
jgi:hypothetical protein